MSATSTGNVQAWLNFMPSEGLNRLTQQSQTCYFVQPTALFAPRRWPTLMSTLSQPERGTRRVTALIIEMKVAYRACVRIVCSFYRADGLVHGLSNLSSCGCKRGYWFRTTDRTKQRRVQYHPCPDKSRLHAHLKQGSRLRT